MQIKAASGFRRQKSALHLAIGAARNLIENGDLRQ
jgi:hypothetical protein